MTGYNLPPGCSVSDIPGNRPEDVLEDAFWEALEDRCRAADIPAPDPGDGNVDRLIEIVRELAYGQGFEDGRSEEQMSRAMSETEDFG